MKKEAHSFNSFVGLLQVAAKYALAMGNWIVLLIVSVAGSNRFIVATGPLLLNPPAIMTVLPSVAAAGPLAGTSKLTASNCGRQNMSRSATYEKRFSSCIM